MITTAFDTLRRDRNALLAELRDSGADVQAPDRIRCPFHDDENPSAGVYQTDEGVWRFKCHGGACEFNGDIADVRSKSTGVPVEQVLREMCPMDVSTRRTPPLPPPPPAAKKKPARIFESLDALIATFRNVEGVYRYTNPDTGDVDYVAIRHRPDPAQGKRFVQCSPVPGGWVMQKPDGLLPLYNRTRVRDADHVVIVEGEKCVHALDTIGIVATTSPGGAGKAALADWSPLAGKTVTLWSDNDLPDKKGKRGGIAHMREIVTILESLEPPCNVHWIDVDALNIPPKGDVADVIEACADATEAREIVETMIDDAESLGPSRDLLAQIRDTGAGRRKAIPFPWAGLSNMTRACLPGTVTVVCGAPGSAKSFMILQAVAHWFDSNVPVAILEMEDTHADHLSRAFCQRCGDVNVLDDRYILSHSEEVEALYMQHQTWLDGFGRCVHAQPDGDPMTLEQVTEWIERMAIAGKRIIVVDPITAAVAKEKRWLEDQQFVQRAKRIAEQYEVSLVIVTHPHKNAGGRRTLEDVAGGVCYTRFAQTVFWLTAHRPPEEVRVFQRSDFGDIQTDVEADRLISISKTRNANGAGLQLAFTLNKNTLRFQELGVIIAD